MGFFGLTVPFETTNLVIGPSAEAGTLNTVSGIGTAYGTAINSGSAYATVTVVGTAYAFRGNYSYYCQSPGTSGGTIYSGPKLNLGSAPTANTDHVASFYAMPYPSVGTVPGTVYLALDGSAQWASGSVLYTAELIEQEGTAWARYGATVQNTVAGAGTSLSILTAGNCTQNWYVDCVQVEPGTVASTYLDHDTPDCNWPHPGKYWYSHTERRDNVRSGGVVKDFADDYHINVMKVAGHQSPPQQQSSLSRAALDGAMWLKTRTTERAITLGCSIEGSSLENYHARRDDFWYDIQRDRVSPVQPFMLRYTGAGKTLQIPVVYDTGMEGGEMLGPYSEAFPLRMIAYDDPYWSEVKQGQALLNNSAEMAVYGAVGYLPASKWSATNGHWDALGITALGGNNTIKCFAKDSKGNLYVGGDFLDLNGIVAADYIAKRSPDGTWSAMGTGTGGIVNTMAVDKNDNVYVGGSFINLTDANGDYVSMWNGTAFVSMDSGTDGAVTAIVVGKDGSVYVGGSFTEVYSAPATPVASTTWIAKWDGTNWSALGTGGTGVPGLTGMVMEPGTGDIIVCGTFGTFGGVSGTSYLARWDVSASAWVAFTNSVTNGSPACLAYDHSGVLYMGGSVMTVTGMTGAVYIAKYNGAFWSPLSTQPDGAVNTIAEGNGQIIACGAFTTIGGVSVADRAAVWNGSTWSSLPVDFPGAATVYAVFVDRNYIFSEGVFIRTDDIYYGFDKESLGDGNAVIYGVGTANGSVTNPGTAKAYPIIIVTRSGGTSASLQGIRNESTGKEITMVHALQDGETVWLDLRPGRKVFMSRFPSRNLLSEINPASDLATWCLIPGQNKIGVMCPGVGSPTITVRMVWDIKHWSVDGGAH